MGRRGNHRVTEDTEKESQRETKEHTKTNGPRQASGNGCNFLASLCLLSVFSVTLWFNDSS
jgi:hypothetical protein